MLCVHYAHDVEKTGNHNVFRSITGGGKGNGGAAPIEHTAKDIEPAGPNVAHEPENIKQGARLRLIDLAFNGHAQGKHGPDAKHEHKTANPALLNEVSRAGNDPAQRRRQHRHRRDRYGRRFWLCVFGGCSFSICHLDKDQFALNFTCNFRPAVPDEHVHFTAHAKFAEKIDSRLNGEAGIGNDLAFVFGFEVVHVGAVAMHVHANRMPGAVDEVVSVSGSADV